ncbi:Add66p NDAI_0A03910 [Naumovozyma dairenensis CBS 421]|uniref:Proteasome assembly chaperone 2 n=1 Tax=Naumovozyma dairenensis (strain ATCC 10597 / BCRC 20456 / CBS 421 / NBRC 0211 / NRRL Y-12639) TaxID=1071378 RepID=G0W410_NAUDC|nr:hypothetical protein NDAI_0A03910 [Naumovozyma dairenensis CBS 421]CCD22548.1 hypothetical protein NDAI_0A03910 [Naumovozyma dairenensis CBS 421]
MTSFQTDNFIDTNNETTLLLPLVSTGNVPQLSVDLMLHTLAPQYQFIKDIHSNYLHPFLGPLDYSIDQSKPILYEEFNNNNNNTKKFSSNLELFYNKSKNFYILQQRTPIIQGYLNNFFKEIIIPLLTNLNVKTIIILDSFGSFDDSFPHAINHNHRVLPSSSNEVYSLGSCNLNNINELSSTFDSIMNLNNNNNTNNHNNYDSNFGIDWFKFTEDSIQQEISTNQDIFKIAYHLINSNISTPSSSSLNEIKYISCFIHEGDNSFDAKLFTETIFKLLNWNNDKDTNSSSNQGFVLKTPVSWKGVYGFNSVSTAFDEGLYI